MKGKILSIREESHDAKLSDGKYVVEIGNNKYKKEVFFSKFKKDICPRFVFDYQVGDTIYFQNRSIIERFVERLEKINISVILVGNLPWIYIDSINGKKVIEKYSARHGFCAFFNKVKKIDLKENILPIDFSNRREVFKLIRRYAREL